MVKNWKVSAFSTIPVVICAISTTTNNSTQTHISNTTDLLNITKNEQNRNTKFYTNTSGTFIYEVSQEKDDLELVNTLIKNEFNRDVAINVLFDSELDRYFFVIKTNENTFENDYANLLHIDEKLKDINLKDNRVTVTLEEE
ncbi:TPA: hypothetical protein I0H43_RS14140 [Enterococcus faecalis]|nr:hypothetical protein [Enterococcus faecalis]